MISHISRYILYHLFFPFLSSLTFLTSIVLIFYMKEMIKAAVEKGIPTWLLFKLLISTSGWILALTIPMAALLGTIVAVGQMNTDSEIIAMRAGGISYARMFRPFLVFAIMLASFQLWFNHFIVPYSTTWMESTIIAIRHFDPTVALEDGLFTKLDEKDGVARYIFIEKSVHDSKTQATTLYNIQLRQTKRIDGVHRLDQLTIAQTGKKVLKVSKNSSQKALRLYNGYFFINDREKEQFQRVDFSNGYMDFNLYEQDALTQYGKSNKPEEMDYFELQKKMKETEEDSTYKKKLLLELHKRFSKPMATILFVFLGFPLAITNTRSGRGGGIGLAMIFIFLYFVLLLSADTLVLNQKLMSPFWATWLSNFSILCAGTFFYMKRTNESSWLLSLKK